jgi:hypothetical protein
VHFPLNIFILRVRNHKTGNLSVKLSLKYLEEGMVTEYHMGRYAAK